MERRGSRLKHAGAHAGSRLKRGGLHAVQLTQAAVGGFFTDRCPQFGAALSFFVVLSLFPLAILATSIAGLIFEDAASRREVVDFLIKNLPLTEQQGRADVEGALKAVTGGARTVGVLGLAGVLFTSSAVLSAVRAALNEVWDVEHGRPPLLGKLFDLALALAAGLLVAATVALTLVKRLALNLDGTIGSVVSAVLEHSSGLIPLALVVTLFAFVLLVVPDADNKLRDIWPGILVATLGYKAAEQGFAYYVAHFGRYDAIYGSIGAIIVFMVFLYIAAMAFLMGAEFARHWPGVRDAEDDGEGEPFSSQLAGFLRGLVKRTDQ